ncbi:DUF572-domain-containing protein [Suhomyces tanzawaensis NRRL Y-17324]|uniref:Splicing factor YJU2 n=1 Tax=Suhomyces tanzawaensis NRRL Y-17324 TaxID=984487 RepID=A0A1E4SFS3_9ASCO|nr:DUF572-domain-containing protein [Suhomyces tanzawaensis NRRL Y-17324]ODV78363.1 DUF572-domain-containing protein [Suhomyces tanzawaensis NRRL Y-17324]
MSERKAINKYYPPDYDPSQVKKKRKTGTGTPDIKIRMMAPYSMRCLKCNEYIAQRRSFNARKEVTNEKYLSTKIIRFHITCPRCNNKITFKTNPQTAGYTPEEGAVRNYEPKAPAPKSQETEDELLQRLEKEENENQSFQTLKEQRKKNPFWQKSESLKDGDGDMMQNLEKKLQDQQRQQMIDDQLEELHYRNSQLKAKGGDEVLASEAKAKLQSEINKLEGMKQELHDQEDNEVAKRAFDRKRAQEGKDDKRAKEEAATAEKSMAKAVEDLITKTSTEPVRKSIESSFTLKKKPSKNQAEAGQHGKKSGHTKSLASALGAYSSSDEE